MAVINILSPHVADMIAAGEVVERPGSVVKELMENALDAGAKNVTVELKGGGATYIRVTDDGCGMAPDDAGNCFLRHATSKLRDERGLEAIETMGFRGEALAAISAVSRVDLLTRRREDAEGTFVSVQAGDIQDMHAAGCPQGTVFTVRDIFYNTPARLKFMKSDRAEGSFCVQQAARVALGRPDVSVRCVKDGKEEFFTPGDGRPESALYAILGRDAALSMLPAEGENEGVAVSGFISSPAAGRGSRAMQFFFVNGRSIRSQSLQAALEQAYKNTLMVGRFPACVLYITLSPGAVDVNVHPTKNEVKFSSEKRVFDAVYYSALSALQGEKDTLQMRLSKSTEKKLAPQAPVREKTPPTPAPEQTRMDLHSPRPAYGTGASVVYTPRPTPKSSGGYSLPKKSAPAPAAPARSAAVRTPAAAAPEKPAPAAETPITEDAPVRVAGEVLRTYIIAEQGDKILLIDKHAAHERMNFDRLKAMGRQIMSQALLQPQIWRPAPEDREAIAANEELLRDMGFELEAYGEEDMIVRAVPEGMDPGQTGAALEEICEKLRTGAHDLARDGVLQTIACKAAIKAGWDTDPAELQVLAEKVASGEIKYCPHGRPVAVTLTKKELDRQFGRIQH